MSTRKSLLGILISLVLGALILAAGSSSSIPLWNLPMFFLCGFLGFLLHWLVFIPSYLNSTEHYFDLTGSISYVLIVLFACYASPILHVRDLIICAMILIWALRLGSFLFLRVKKAGQDRRFEVMKYNFLWFLMTWTIGGLWVLITLGAGLAAITSSVKLDIGFYGFLGIFLWAVGFLVEVISDNQKAAFRKIEENKDKFMNTGLWSWSQHPNYFGEILLWLGVACISFPVLSGAQLATLISPIFVYFLLTKVSGIPLLDRLADKKWGDSAAYTEYKKTTSTLFLLPPRK